MAATASSGQVVLTWNSVASSYYYIYRQPLSPANDTYLYAGQITNGKLPYTDTNVTNGTAYQYAVATTNANGEGNMSGWVAATPLGTPVLTAEATAKVLYPATGESGAGRASMTMAYQYPGGPETYVRHYDEGFNSGPVRETDYTYGQEGEALTVSGSAEPVTYTYDLLYRKSTLMDGNGHVTSYFYNTAGYLYQTAYPGASTSQLTAPLAAGSADTITNTSYDTLGDVLTRVDGRG